MQRKIHSLVVVVLLSLYKINLTLLAPLLGAGQCGVWWEESGGKCMVANVCV